MPEQLPTEVRDLTPAARLVYLALEGEVLDQGDLADRTGLSKRRIREVANTLDENGAIASYQHPSDGRRRIYFDPDAFDAIGAHQTYTVRQSEK